MRLNMRCMARYQYTIDGNSPEPEADRYILKVPLFLCPLLCYTGRNLIYGRNTMKTELYLEAGASLAEGIFYHRESGALYWVDIEGKKIHRTDLQSKADRVWDTPSRVGAVFLTAEQELYAALEDGVYRVADGSFERYCAIPGGENMRTNDGKCDARGRIWLGTMEMTQSKPVAGFYKIEKGGCAEMLREVRISNGLCFSHDGRYLYYIDTPSGFLWRFDYDGERGTIENRIPLIDYRERQGGFDGMTIDSDGQLWVAEWGGFKVSAWDPETGRQTFEIAVPVPCVSCCSFGGDDYRDLYITTAKSDDYPLSGSLFVCGDTGSRGVAPHLFCP